MVRNLVIATVDRKRQPDRSVPPKPIRANGSHPGRSRIQSVMWLVLVAALGASLHVHLSMRGAEADPAPLGQDSGFPLTRGPFEVIIASHGVIQPSEVVDVGAQVSGQLSTLLVNLGDRVESGQPLAEIDDRRIRARLVQGEAAIDTLRAQISAKQAQHAHARIQQARTETLSDRNIASRAQAELVQTTTTVLAAEVRSLEAQLAGQEAAVEGIRLDLSHTRITAPVDGVVTAIVAQRGRTLNANQQTPVVLRISRDRPLILVARVPEADAERVQPGMSVRFTPVGGSSQTFEGIVGNIMRAPTIVNGAVFLDAFIELDGERHFLPFGRSAQAFIIVERLDCAVLLPRDSLPDGAAAGETIKVTLRDQAGHLVVRVLKLRGVNEVNAAIACEDADKAGITPSDRVVNVGRYLRVGA
jgi:macrolide-specific efflux system membrane fusion protein